MVKERVLRADAERNRRHILEVAQTVFASEGLSIPIDEIARRAGLGVGTLYRHFPTKEALFTAIVVTRMEDVVAYARTLLEAKDAGEAFFAFLAHMVKGWSQKKDFMDALASAGVDLKDLARAKQELYLELGKLLARAQEDGSVRTDIDIREILALVSGTFSIERHGLDAKGRERMLVVILDGLRPPAGSVTAKVRTRAR